MADAVDAAPAETVGSEASADDASTQGPIDATQLIEEANQASNKLYWLYFLSASCSRMWDFTGVVFVVQLIFLSLLPASILGVSEYFAAAVCSPFVGYMIDSYTRDVIVQRAIIVGAGSLVGACVFIFLAFDALGANSSTLTYALILLAILCSMVAKVAFTTIKISITKDWALALVHDLAPNDAHCVLLDLNAKLLRADLLTTILSPVFIGILILVLGFLYLPFIFAAIVIAFAFLQLRIAVGLFRDSAVIQLPRAAQFGQRSPFVSLEDLKAYVNHSCFLTVSLPYALLYISILSFGSVMVSFFLMIRLEQFVTALGQGAAALTAFCSTIVVPRLVRYFSSNQRPLMADDANNRLASPALIGGLIKVGTIMIWFQVVCLAPFVSLIVFFHFTGIVDLTTGPCWLIVLLFLNIISSRFGLWGFDLAQVQLMQQLEPESVGRINGAQESLVSVCQISSYLLTLKFSTVDDFYIPCIFSFSAVLGAAILFTINTRKKLLNQMPMTVTDLFAQN